VVGLISHAGLASIKAKRIKEILKEILRREGTLSLACLTSLKTADSLRYLRSLKGLGPKTAACVLLFSFGKPVMPVDTHIFRVTKRLGLICGNTSIEEAHEILTASVPRHLIYDFHLGIIEHGRRTCHAQNPGCGVCVLYKLCRYKKKVIHKVADV
jgi:endonuclease-3